MLDNTNALIFPSSEIIFYIFLENVAIFRSMMFARCDRCDKYLSICKRHVNLIGRSSEKKNALQIAIPFEVDITHRHVRNRDDDKDRV